MPPKSHLEALQEDYLTTQEKIPLRLDLISHIDH